MSGDLAYLGLAEASALIRTKKLSPAEYVTALLARIERYDAKYNAFIAAAVRYGPPRPARARVSDWPPPGGVRSKHRMSL